MAQRYGYFDDENREYVIIRPDTPTPWYNYIHNAEHCGLISHTAGGTSFRRDARHMRLLRYRFNNLPPDRPGRYIYIRDDEAGRFWSATWAPTCPPLDRYEFRCHVGLGYQRIVSRYEGIQAEITYFCPPDDPCEIWLLNVTNTGRKTRRLSLFSYAELCLWSALRDMINMDAPRHTTRIAMQPDGVILHYSYTDLGLKLTEMQFVQFFGFAACDRPFVGYEINREDFIGPNRGEANPLVVETGRHRPDKSPTGNPLASFHHRLRLKPGQTERIVYMLGVCDGPRAYRPIVRKYSKPGAAERALQDLKAERLQRLTRQQIRTPDKAFNTLVNTWNPYQAIMTFHLSRSISPFYTGLGRGIGFRDTSQDCLAATVLLPDLVPERLSLLLANQFAGGTVSHNFFPLTGEGDGANFYDDHLWFILTVSLYCKETGDLDFLARKVKFRDRGSGTIFEHTRRALDASWRLVGRHGLCLTGTADWNDAVNPPPGSESVFVSMLYCKALTEAAELATRLGEKRLARLWLQRYKTMKQRINRYGWDGKWYRRHLLPDGSAVGSATCREGKIFLEPQAWSIISGVATPKRAKTVIASIKRYLLTPHGVKLVHPPFSSYDPTVGSVGIFRPGLKENGSVFCHTNPWVTVAMCMMGLGDDALDVLRRISPVHRNKIIEIHQNEPYVFSQFIAAPPHPQAGRAWNAWLTGTASWAYIAATQYILGIRPDFDGLIIDPCIPRSWRRITVSRKFRGTTYEITILNPRGRSGPVTQLTVNGRTVKGNRVPLQGDQELCKVRAVIG